MTAYMRPTDFISQPIAVKCEGGRITATDERGLVLFSCSYWLYCRMIERGWVIE